MARDVKPFGLRLSTESARDLARAAVTTRPENGVALVVTPNIDHIATIRRSPTLARAYRNAARIVCDGWPVQLYARLCGLPVARVTGCEITAELMGLPSYPDWHRFFFVVDTVTTQQAVKEWAATSGLACEVVVPPFGFERNPDFCTRLARLIDDHRTTVLVMAVGAPRSEVYVDTYRASLPNCWAFCVGQAVKIQLGLVRRASSAWQFAGMEWLWRLQQEPHRLAKRYMKASVGFSLAVLEDQLRGGLRNLQVSPK